MQPGDVVIGLPSSGLHSNGYSLARHALFKKGGMSLSDQVPGTSGAWRTRCCSRRGCTSPRRRRCGRRGITPHGMAHISGGGLLNIARLAADVSYELDALASTISTAAVPHSLCPSPRPIRMRACW